MFFFSMTRKFSSIILSGSVNTWTANQWLPITRSYRCKHFGLWPVTNVKYHPGFHHIPGEWFPRKRGSPKVAEGKSCLSDSICVFSELDLHSANILDPIEMKTLALEMAEKKIGTKFVSRQFVTNWCNLMWFPWYWFEMWKSFRPNENVLGAFHSCPCVNLLMSAVWHCWFWTLTRTIPSSLSRSKLTGVMSGSFQTKIIVFAASRLLSEVQPF